MFSSKMRFTLLSSSDMQRLSHVHVVNKALYLQDNSREPALYGVLDRRMVSSVNQGLIKRDLCCHANTVLYVLRSYFNDGGCKG